MQLKIDEISNIVADQYPHAKLGTVSSPAFNRKKDKIEVRIEDKIDKVVQHIDEEKEKKHNKTAIAVGGSVIWLSILVAIFNPRISSKLIEKLKNLQLLTKTKFNTSKDNFLRSNFYRVVSKIAEKITKTISFLNNTNSVKDTYFKKLCTEEKTFPNVENPKRLRFLQKTDKVVRAIFSKPHKALTKWGDSLAKHTVKKRYRTADITMNNFEYQIKSFYGRLTDSDKKRFDEIVKRIKADREYFNMTNLQNRFSDYEKLMENLDADIRKQWVYYAKGFVEKDVNSFEHFNKNLSFWAQDIMSKKREGVNQAGIQAVDKLFGSISENRGAYNELIEIIKPYMSDKDLVKLRKSLAKTEKKLRNANKSECMEYFDKKRDLVLGSAPTDIVTAIFGVTAGAIAIKAADDKDKRISRLITGVFPAIAGIGTNIALTSMLFSGPKGMIIAAITGSVLSLIGNKINNYRLKLLGKQEPQAQILPAGK